MKKIFLIAAGVSILFASCKKEQVNPASGPSMDKQVADLIMEADPGLYEQVYGGAQRTSTEPTLLVTHGIFHFGSGQPEDGTCLPNSSCVCHITVLWPALIDPNKPPGEIDLQGNFVRAFSDKGEAALILNTSSGAVNVDNLKTINIEFDSNGGSTLAYDVL